MRPANPETDQLARSLLQKAVRRGHAHLALAVADYLRAKHDGKAWLGKRVWVIAAEECWPLLEGFGGESLRVTQELIDQKLVEIASATKQKDAAGLGTLAFESGKLATLDSAESALKWHGSFDLKAVRYVRRALENDEGFFQWAFESARGDRERRFLMQAKAAYKRAGWPWDKSFAIAAAYLAVTEGIPDSVRSPRSVSEQAQGFPYWVAVDRHTKEGKAALRQVARELNVPYEQVGWASFYEESALTDGRTGSGWWEREVEWRLSRVELSPNEANVLWRSAKPVFMELVRESAELLQARIGPFYPSAINNEWHQAIRERPAVQSGLKL